MSCIEEIIRKAEYFQKKSNYEQKDDVSIDQYKTGMMCYLMKDYDGAEYWWEQAARNHNKKAKAALLKLYNNELRHKYDYLIGPVPISASRRTRGGNAPHYVWE